MSFHKASQLVADRPAEPPSSTRDPRMCHAYGCPLAGGISESTTGGGTWFCRFHFGTDLSMWPEITGLLRKRGPITSSEPTDAVKQVRARMYKRPAKPERQPGED